VCSVQIVFPRMYNFTYTIIYTGNVQQTFKTKTYTRSSTIMSPVSSSKVQTHTCPHASHSIRVEPMDFDLLYDDESFIVSRKLDIVSHLFVFGFDTHAHLCLHKQSATKKS